jgi:hypothetical protein
MAIKACKTPAASLFKCMRDFSAASYPFTAYLVLPAGTYVQACEPVRLVSVWGEVIPQTSWQTDALVLAIWVAAGRAPAVWTIAHHCQ